MEEVEEGQVVVEEATGASSTPVCLLMKPCSACTEGRVTLQGIQAPVARQHTASTQSPCPPSLRPPCQAQEEQAF